MIASGGGTFGDRSDSTMTDVPPTLQGLLTQRLERLRDHRDVIDLAAVLGRDFELEPLAALVPLGDALADLTDAGRDPAGRRRARALRVHPRAAARGRLHAPAAHPPPRPAPARRRAADRAARRARAGDRRAPLAARRRARPLGPVLARGRRAGDRPRRVPEAADHLRRGLEALDRAGPGPATARSSWSGWRGTLQAGVGYGADGVDVAYAEARRLGVGERLGTVGRGQWAFSPPARRL